MSVGKGQRYDNLVMGGAITSLGLLAEFLVPLLNSVPQLT